MSLTEQDKAIRDKNRFYKAGGVKLIYQLLSAFNTTENEPIKLDLLRRKAFEIAKQCNMQKKQKYFFIITLFKQARGKGYLYSPQEPFDVAKMFFPIKKDDIKKSNQITFYITKQGNKFIKDWEVNYGTDENKKENSL